MFRKCPFEVDAFIPKSAEELSDQEKIAVRKKFPLPTTALTFPRLHVVSDEAVDLISKLLDRDPGERLGALQNGESNVKYHPWFADVDFIAFLEGKGKIELPRSRRSSLEPNEVDKIFSPTTEELFEEEFDEF